MIYIIQPAASHAGGLIRDAEIETTLRAYANPIFKAAGLKPSAVSIYIVQDPSLNAFVAGGSNLFLHTGMILASETPDMLLGVMAHETGHIAGGHLAKGSEQLKNAQLGTIMAAVLGAAAAAATGKPEAAAAVMGGGSNSIQRNFLAFTRANENAADQAALNYLDELKISASGMADVFALLKRQERQHFGHPDPYLRTHPLTNDRMVHIDHHVETSSIAKGAYPAALKVKHERMLAKLYAFMEPPEKTLRKYAANDRSVSARMARAIAFFLQAKMDEAMVIMDGLNADYPNDAFIYDLKGQMLFESGRMDEAYQAYHMASKLAPRQPLILADLAKVELTRESQADYQSAIKHLDRSLALDKYNSFAWRLMATAYGKQNNQPMASLALAEESLLIGDVEQAIIQSNRAMQTLPMGSPAEQRAKDIKQRALQMKKEQEEAESLL